MNLAFLLTRPLFAAAQGAACGGKGGVASFFSFPTWYEYLPSTYDNNGVCSPSLTSLTDVWLIVAAVIEILLRLAALMAVGFIIYGGVQYIISQGSSEQTNAARNTIVSAVVGLVICIVGAIVVAFVAGRFN